MICSMPWNLRKGGGTPEETGMSLVREPKVPIWIPLLTLNLGIEKTPAPWKNYLYLNAEMAT